MIKNSEKYNKAREMRSRGASFHEIAKATGLTVKTVGNYCAGVLMTEIGNPKFKMTFEKECEWTEAVNRLRRYYGKEPLPMPEFRAQVPGR